MAIRSHLPVRPAGGKGKLSKYGWYRTSTRQIIFLSCIALLHLASPPVSIGYWWGLNYIPTADSWPSNTFFPQAYEGGYLKYNWKDPITNERYKLSFWETDTQWYTFSLGLPTLKITKEWKIDWDVGLNWIQPDSPFYDEVQWDTKIKFLSDGQFHIPYLPAMAVGIGYLGGRLDLDFYEKFDTQGRYHHPNASYPTFYLVASKNLPIPHLAPQITLTYMWNNYGINEEDVWGIGGYGWIWPEKVGWMIDWYGGDLGYYGLGLFWQPVSLIGFTVSYYFPNKRDYQSSRWGVRIEDFNAEQLFFGFLLTIPLKFLTR